MADTEWRDIREEEERIAGIRSALAAQPKPDTPQEYDVSEAALWTHRHLPVGSVISYISPESVLDPAGTIAVLVLASKSEKEGFWLEVKPVGCSNASFKSKLGAYFRGQRKVHHICYPDSEGSCSLHDVPGVHLREFKWFPPGDFNEEWLSKTGRKVVQEGMELASKEVSIKEASSKKKGREKGLSPLEERLRNLRLESGRRVSFAGEEEEPSSSRPGDGPSDGPRAGVLRRPRGASYESALVVRPQAVKDEVIDVDSEGETTSKSRTGKKSRPRGVGETLAQAVATHRTKQKETEEKRKRRSRSRSVEKKKKKRKRSRRHSSSEDSSAEPSEGESSSNSLQPPLRKRSLRDPGSVYKMLVAQAAEHLTQDGLEFGGEEGASAAAQKVKMYTYYQLALKPALDSRSRDAKELALLAKALDLLQSGDLAQLADLLAARLIAVDTATRQGWQAARYLEIQSHEDDGTAPPHILLAAMKHQKQVEKAGGKGSWSRGAAWQWDWQSEGRGKGKTKDQKGKGKKGKGKNKAGKGGWNAWPGGGNEKPAEKTTKGDS